MDRSQFEHVLAAAADVVGAEEIVVIGSQAILGPRPDAPASLLRSIEVDLFPKDEPERAIEIDGAIGDGSPFHETFGYYAHGVGPETARAPAGWQDRLIAVEIPARPGASTGTTAHCLEPHDLVLAKCAAGRERDWEFAGEAVAAGIVDRTRLLERVDELPLEPKHRAQIRRHVEGL